MAWPTPHVAGPRSGCLFMFCGISSSVAFCCSEDIAKTLRETIQGRVGKETVVPDHEVLTYGLCMCILPRHHGQPVRKDTRTFRGTVAP